MVKTVRWHKKALKALRNIVTYLQDEASDKTANRFIDTIYREIDSLKTYPEKGRKSPKRKTIRFINVDKHRQLFYRVNGTTLYISNIFDTRQNPNKRPY